MSLLDSISTYKKRSPILTIMGDAGVGKTTLASTFNNPIVIRTEDGMQSVADLNVPCFPVAKSSNDVLSQIHALIKEDHEYKTLIIDSVTRLDNIISEEVIKSDENNPKSLNQALGGYGSGYEAVSNVHARVRAGCDILNNEKGMTIIFIGHALVETVSLPDMQPYNVFELKVARKSRTHYVDNVDLVGFLKVNAFVKEDSKTKEGKAFSNGERVLITHANSAYVTKNRYGFTENIKVPKNTNPLLEMLY